MRNGDSMTKVIVGMSGGVDSSVSAILLQEQGYEVVGATMVLFDSNDINEGCLSSSAVNDAKKVCQKLGIEHHVIDLKDYFKKYVINNFVENYKNGMTPNPCVQCNKYLKFGALFDKAKELKCEYIATGHYARVEDGYLKKSNADKKDQTYFLYGIKKEVLPYIVFPLKDFKDKEEIREIAKKHDLFVATKKQILHQKKYFVYINTRFFPQHFPLLGSPQALFRALSRSFCICLCSHCLIQLAHKDALPPSVLKFL